MSSRIPEQNPVGSEHLDAKIRTIRYLSRSASWLVNVRPRDLIVTNRLPERER